MSWKNKIIYLVICIQVPHYWMKKNNSVIYNLNNWVTNMDSPVSDTLM